MFHYKPSISGYPHLWKSPCMYIYNIYIYMYIYIYVCIYIYIITAAWRSHENNHHHIFCWGNRPKSRDTAQPQNCALSENPRRILMENCWENHHKSSILMMDVEINIIYKIYGKNHGFCRWENRKIRNINGGFSSPTLWGVYENVSENAHV